MTSPEGWRLASLSELLDDEQLDTVAKILNKHGGQPVSTCLPELRAYLITLRDSLEAKGILPEFLTYAIADAVAKGATLRGDDCPHSSSHSE